MNKLPLAGVNFFEEPQFSRQSVILFFIAFSLSLVARNSVRTEEGGGRGWKGEKSVPESVLFLLFLCWQHKNRSVHGVGWMRGERKQLSHKLRRKRREQLVIHFLFLFSSGVHRSEFMEQRGALPPPPPPFAWFAAPPLSCTFHRENFTG